MNYAYIRVSSDKQTVDNQRSMIKNRGYKIDKWLCDEAVSGTVDWHKREIEKAISNSVAGDYIIVAEISRIGRSLKQILEVVELCQEKGVVIVCIREGIELSDNNPMTKMILSILGSLAEMERNLISERTKDALKRKRDQGVVLGRPKGTGGKTKCVLFGKEEKIIEMFKSGMSLSAIARKLSVHRGTLRNYLKYIPELCEVDYKKIIGSEYCLYNKDGELLRSVTINDSVRRMYQSVRTVCVKEKVCKMCGSTDVCSHGLCRKCYVRSWTQENKEHCRELRKKRELKKKIREEVMEELYQEAIKRKSGR